jgi:hypothetical protein
MSEIFKAYTQLAIEKGLVKNAEEDKDAKKRAPTGSTLSSVEVLYGVKPNEKEDETHIMEQAHPGTVVIAPSYDAINGLVENNIQRQNIIINQLMKPNRGIADLPKLAKQDLIFELVRISNDLDNANEVELCKLADACIEQLAVKNAGAGTLAGGAAAALAVGTGGFGPVAIAVTVAAVGTAIWLYNHFSGSSKGLSMDIKSVEDAIANLQETSWYETNLRGEFKKVLSSIYTQVEDYKHVAGAFTAIVGTYNAETHDMIKELAAGPEGERIHAAFLSFYNKSKSFAGAMEAYAAQLENGSFQKNQKQEGGFWDSGIAGSINEVLHGGHGLFKNEFDELSQSLTRLVKGIHATLETSRTIFNREKVQAEKEADFDKEETPAAKEVKAPEAPVAPASDAPVAEKTEEKGIVSTLGNAWKSLIGG